MQIETIFSVVLSAASFLKKPLQDAAVQPIRDGYEAAKGYLIKKLGTDSEAAVALEKAIENPDSKARKAVLMEEATTAGLKTDVELARLVKALKAALPTTSANVRQRVDVKGHRNVVEMAGRDLIKTQKHVQRNAITPDERHLSSEQKEKLKPVVAELADRLAREDGKPNFGAVYNMLERQYQVTSYLLIPREMGDEAITFLKQQRAINRSRLRRRNPQAYANDFFRVIYAASNNLGWDKPQLYQFAFEKLALKKSITSLKQLGPNQLKALSEFIRRAK